jgi:hypothetical protein
MNELFREIRSYVHFLFGLKGFFGRTLRLKDAVEIIQRRFQQREENFLCLVEKAIFRNPRSPYLPLLKMAGCEFGDLRQMVQTRGLEKTLDELRKNDVYFTFEEFKGRKKIHRGGKTFGFQPQDFDNPHLSRFYMAATGGSTGVGKRVPMDLDHLAAQTPNIMVAYHTYGILEIPTALWMGILPAPAGVNHILRHAHFGHSPERWFTPVSTGDMRFSPKNWLATKGIVGLGRLYGKAIPYPEKLPLDRSSTLVRWAAEKLRSNGRCQIRAGVSMSLRISVAARRMGVDLTGVTFITGGEPLTRAKIQGIRESGASVFPSYFFTETGVAGMGCAEPADENDIHFFDDLNAVIQFPRQVHGADVVIYPFYFTSLLPTAPKILLNVEIDDYGVIDRRSCGCGLEKYGYKTHLCGIRSFGKLTSEGVTLVGSEMLKILEEVLPARFGGSPLDFQLREVEDQSGFTRLHLIIDPEVCIRDEDAVVQTLLGALQRSSVSADYSKAIWEQAKTVQVIREKPAWTERGKMPSLLSRRRNSSR